MHIIRADDHRAMPWKNGGGITYEVAIDPPGARSLDAFDWRVSMARVESDGPFSRFAGIDRSLAVMQGDGLRLVVDGTNIELGPNSRPLVFSGDVPVTATLVNGPILDLNVMTRRDVFRHRLTREPVVGGRTVAATADATLLVVRTGAVAAAGRHLQPRDAVMLARQERVELAAAATAELFRIEIERH